MKILIITSRFPYPLEKGDKLRAYHQIKHLSRVAELHLFSLSHKSIRESDRIELLKYCKTVHIFQLSNFQSLIHAFLALLLGLPMQVGYFYRRRVKTFIAEWVNQEKPDRIYCQLLRTARYAQGLETPAVIDLQDCFSAGMERRAKVDRAPFSWIFKLESILLRKYEETCFHSFHKSTIISANDRDLLTFESKESVEIVPNGVDTEFFSPQSMEQEIDILFTGNLSYPPNVDAAQFLVHEILPMVRKVMPKVNVMLAGANPSAAVRNLASSDVVVTGWVDDIRSAYGRCRVFIAPMRIGTGLQNKLLEAMSMAKPCITTSLANGSLQATPNVHILIGDTAAELAEQIIALLQDSSLAIRIKEEGHEFVKSHYSWPSSVDRLFQIISSEILDV